MRMNSWRFVLLTALSPIPINELHMTGPFSQGAGAVISILPPMLAGIGRQISAGRNSASSLFVVYLTRNRGGKKLELARRKKCWKTEMPWFSIKVFFFFLPKQKLFPLRIYSLLYYFKIFNNQWIIYHFVFIIFILLNNINFLMCK